MKSLQIVDVEKHTAYISVGSNIGRKLFNCQKGVSALTKSGSTVITNRSCFYKTEPVDFKDQDWFVNAVVKIDTGLDPFKLLNEIKSIEIGAGRSLERIRFGPRPLDLDIIMYADWVINSSRLVIPHPRMHKRCFVLKPFCDIDPKIVHPVLKKDLKYLLDHLDDKGQKIVRYSCDY